MDTLTYYSNGEPHYWYLVCSGAGTLTGGTPYETLTPHNSLPCESACFHIMVPM